MLTSRALARVAVAVLAIAPPAQSHVIMTSPKPFGSPSNSPLDPSGSDYPCHVATFEASGGSSTDWTVGSTQQLSFSGTAVHGGGSCQISATADMPPTKDSKFKVIHSIEGGCPGVDGPATFDFEVPNMLPNGDLVVAWTWYNRIGNREIYMNCANVRISGGASNASELQRLPDMALANIEVGRGASCKTLENFDYTFPGAGVSGDTVERIGSGPFVDLCGAQASAGIGSADAAADPDSSSSFEKQRVYTPGSGTEDVAAASVVDQPTTSSASVSPTLAASSFLLSSFPPVASPACATVQGAVLDAVSCFSNDALVCNGESQFGLCSNGQVRWQAVAPGTECRDGQIVARDPVHRAKRDVITC